MSRPVCVLVGPPGAGKSTVGVLLADALGVPFLDTDTAVEAVAGKPIPEIFVDDGEEHFRALERTAVAAALADHAGVVALGGGAVLAAETRSALARQIVVYLEVDFADAVRRVGLGVGRPLLGFNPRATLRHLMDQRAPLYDEVADVVVPTSGVDPVRVTEMVRAALAELARTEDA